MQSLLFIPTMYYRVIIHANTQRGCSCVAMHLYVICSPLRHRLAWLGSARDYPPFAPRLQSARVLFTGALARFLMMIIDNKRENMLPVHDVAIVGVGARSSWASPQAISESVFPPCFWFSKHHHPTGWPSTMMTRTTQSFTQPIIALASVTPTRVLEHSRRQKLPQVLDLAYASSDCVGFSGAFYSRDASCAS